MSFDEGTLIILVGVGVVGIWFIAGKLQRIIDLIANQQDRDK